MNRPWAVAERPSSTAFRGAPSPWSNSAHGCRCYPIFSLIASCALHGLDAEGYLADIIRVLPYWPRDRYLELAPKYWARTRARLVDDELRRAVGHVTVPPLASEQQPSSN